MIGFGKVAKLVCKMARALDMAVLVHTRTKYPGDLDKKMGFTYAEDLTQLLKESNIVSLHLNLTQWTSGMVNNDFLSKMRNDCVLVNTSHADLVKENDLWH